MSNNQRVKVVEDESNLLLSVDGRIINNANERYSLTRLNRENSGEDKIVINIEDANLKYKYILYVYDTEIIEIISDLSFKDLIELKLLIEVGQENPEKYINLGYYIYILPEIKEVSREIEVEYDNWSNPYSPARFFDRLNEEYKVFYEIEDEKIYVGDTITMVFEDKDKIKDALKEFFETTQYLLGKVKENLEQNFKDDTVKLIFEFPEHLRVACEQYLIYFGQFLKDAGESASISMNHSGETTLFSVVPDNKDLSLSKIHDALSIYLNLSNSNNSSVGMLSLQESRMNAVISGFQAQMQSLQAENYARQLENLAIKDLYGRMVENQAEYIAKQSEIILSQSKAIVETTKTTNILAESLKSKDNESENIIPGGIIKVKAYELGPLQLDIPTAIRVVKEIFKRKP